MKAHQMLKEFWQRLKAVYEDRWLVRIVEVVDGDFLPTKMPKRNLVLVRDGKEEWSVGFACPCGCQRTIELLLIPDANPHWKITVDSKGRPTLTPSVWLQGGCRSHFWVRKGKVIWCD